MLFIILIFSYFKLVYNNENSFESIFGMKSTESDNSLYCKLSMGSRPYEVRAKEVNETTSTEDPTIILEKLVNDFMFGSRLKVYERNSQISESDPLLNFPSGDIWRYDMYGNESGVHLPMREFFVPGHCELKIKDDYLQTAVNAFAILSMGTVDDILKLPAEYVLASFFERLKFKEKWIEAAARGPNWFPPKSCTICLVHFEPKCFQFLNKNKKLFPWAVPTLKIPFLKSFTRTISMMKLCYEKFAAFWVVIKGDRNTEDISHEMLENFRPLFKYVNAREIARLDLKNNKILTYVGTHPDLDRHQVGVVAKRYIQLNPDWAKPQYLNMMNNLLCGVPMVHMKNISEAYFLQLSQQVFYHIRACEPLQRRFYLKMMTKTQTLGKPYSWSARDITRLGLLLAEVSGPELSTINPMAMSAISSQVMLEMTADNLKYITEVQQRYLSSGSLNILKKKLRNHKIKTKKSATESVIYTYKSYLIFVILVMQLKALIAPTNIFV